MVLSLPELGTRICILGPSNSGKSTLAQAIGTQLGLPVVHLDQLRFVPSTNWVLKPPNEFLAAHDAAMADRWIIEGNYFGRVPARLARATGIVQLCDARLANLHRYVRRTLFEPHRPGNLEGAQDSLKWDLTWWILWEEPNKRQARRALVRASGLPYVESNSMRELKALYAAWGLPSPTHV